MSYYIIGRAEILTIITLLFDPNSVFIKSFRFLLTFRTKIRCLSRRFSALPCSTSYHTFLLQSKTRLRESNIQQDNFHFYIDFSYSDEIHYHIPIWIVLDYYSRDRGCHKIPGSNKQNLKSVELYWFLKRFVQGVSKWSGRN